MIVDPSIQSLPPPSLKTVLDEAAKELAKDINCIKVGTINSFDATKQLATVQIAQKQITSISPAGVQTVQEYPLLLQVPVFVLFGGLDFLSMPITENDPCILLFNDRQLDNFMTNGAGLPPTIGRVHDLSDAIAVVGIRPLTKLIATYLANGVRLSHGSGVNISKIDLTDALMELTCANFVFNGDVTITGNLNVEGASGADTALIGCNLTQVPGKVLKAGNGATGTFSSVTVADGIVTAGTP